MGWQRIGTHFMKPASKNHTTRFCDNRNCDKTFVQKRPWQVYCSNKCRMEVYTENEAVRIKQLEERHDFYEKEYERLTKENAQLKVQLQKALSQ